MFNYLFGESVREITWQEKVYVYMYTYASYVIEYYKNSMFCAWKHVFTLQMLSLIVTIVALGLVFMKINRMINGRPSTSNIQRADYCNASKWQSTTFVQVNNQVPKQNKYWDSEAELSKVNEYKQHKKLYSLEDILYRKQKRDESALEYGKVLMRIAPEILPSEYAVRDIYIRGLGQPKLRELAMIKNNDLGSFSDLVIYASQMEQALKDCNKLHQVESMQSGQWEQAKQYNNGPQFNNGDRWRDKQFSNNQPRNHFQTHFHPNSQQPNSYKRNAIEPRTQASTQKDMVTAAANVDKQ